MSYIGNTKIGKLFLGSTELSKAYLGNTLIFQKGGGGGILPAGYRQLSYVENIPGNNYYIKTGVNGGNNTGFHIEALIYDKLSGTTGEYGCLFGGRTQSGVNDFQLTSYTGNSSYSGALRTGTGAGVNAHLPAGAKFTAELNGTEYTIGGNSYTVTRDVSSAKEIYLFCLNNNGATQHGHLRIYRFWLTQSGVKVLDYVPCQRLSDGEVGFYDIVANVFVPPFSGTLYGFVNESDLLPVGALPAEMIFSDGYSGWIESYISTAQSMSFKLDIAPVIPESVFQVPLGYYANNNRFSPIAWTSGTTVYELQYGAAHSSADMIGAGVHPMRHYEIKMSAQGGETKEYINGALQRTITYSYSGQSIPSGTLGILTRKPVGDGNWRGGLGEMYWYSDNTFSNLIAHLLPCAINNRAGFWDEKRHRWLLSSGGIVYASGVPWNTQGFLPNSVQCGLPGVRPDYLMDYRGWITSPYFALPAGCQQITFLSGEAMTPDIWNRVALAFYDGDGDFISGNAGGSSAVSVAVPAGTVNVRLSLARSSQNNCYMQDDTNSQYIWKGINV